MVTFKGFLHRWYSVITQLLPTLSHDVAPVLRKSAAAAVKQCTGGDTGRQCGFKWASGAFDGQVGAGQQMSVLGAVTLLLVDGSKPPVTEKSGGTSKGDPNAGSEGDHFQRQDRPMTTRDKVGAGVLTFLALAATCGVFGWMSWDL